MLFEKLYNNSINTKLCFIEVEKQGWTKIEQLPINVPLLYLMFLIIIIAAWMGVVSYSTVDV